MPNGKTWSISSNGCARSANFRVNFSFSASAHPCFRPPLISPTRLSSIVTSAVSFVVAGANFNASEKGQTSGRYFGDHFAPVVDLPSGLCTPLLHLRPFITSQRTDPIPRYRELSSSNSKLGGRYWRRKFRATASCEWWPLIGSAVMLLGSWVRWFHDLLCVWVHQKSRNSRIASLEIL